VGISLSFLNQLTPYSIILKGNKIILHHDVMVRILLAICKSHVLHVESVLHCLKALGGMKCVVMFHLISARSEYSA